MEAVKQGSCAVGLMVRSRPPPRRAAGRRRSRASPHPAAPPLVTPPQSKTHVVLATLKRAQNELSSYQRKLFKIDDHLGIAISGLTADGRVLCKYMRNECINHRCAHRAPARQAAAPGPPPAATSRRRPWGEQRGAAPVTAAAAAPPPPPTAPAVGPPLPQVYLRDAHAGGQAGTASGGQAPGAGGGGWLWEAVR